MAKSAKTKTISQPLIGLSARAADKILDHLSMMVHETGKRGGRIERIQGMDLRYWTDQINRVVRETDRLSSQQERAKRLLVQLELSDRA
jgi:hypothetical protein